ncbi:sugar transferase [Algibacter lectus]|uniref:Lipopolysaccharide/colanic/teichoic acid biosynthesis glycosyltransferase n=1 Tax=Algibacter lectus TaxID=221126 RepID=A0A4R8MGL2_9FLAO|nr:sugar transferase [Algibacter lectus]MWW23662.1 lipid carrier--UDP-N-acetylgalactosaminyltransferase [Algibacter lectus]TDY63657.1 lipopolysaccharide/colanic/teichoic acid biosynthesis glycosyltransferase [Algibacter lectus]
MYFIIKRILDLIIALTALLLLAPIFFVVFVCLLIANQGKAFFYQQRPGKNEKVFKIIKFKTMNDKKDANGEFLPFDQRVTKIGNFIRKYSLDEIPQLINVLKGDMSLVGPRPLLTDYLPLYNEEQKKRHNVKPGITGWAQVKGRNSISWNQKFTYDVWYVENISFLLDLQIMLLTAKRLVVPQGINSSDGLNMTTFTGGADE